jgi:hypothetical protein
MRNKRLLASLGVTVALAAGGVGLVWLGAPGISGAQTGDTTVPPTTAAPEAPPPDAPAPAPDGGEAPERGPGDCPDKGAEGGGRGTPGGSSSDAANLGLRPGGRFIRL